jgi:hypothetical protein
MTKYITDLTSNLIGKHRFLLAAERVESDSEFVHHVYMMLTMSDVHAMSPQKLGEIACDIELQDTKILNTRSDEEISAWVAKFEQKSDQSLEIRLRHMVALALAKCILNRLPLPLGQQG